MDTNPGHLVTASLLSDAFEQAPAFQDPDFISRLISIIDRNSVDIYLPLFPLEIELAAELVANDRLPADLTLLAPPYATSALCADKLRLADHLRRHGLPVPETAAASAPFEADRYFLKPRLGSGSRGAREIRRSELAALRRDTADEWVVQEICSGPELTVDAFYDPAGGVCRTVCRERMRVKSGVATKCRLFFEESIDRMARAVAECMLLRGSFCFQLMRAEAGWRITDINPRPGAATAMCLATGNDFFAATFALARKQDYGDFFTRLAGDSYVTRQYTDFLMRSEQ